MIDGGYVDGVDVFAVVDDVVVAVMNEFVVVVCDCDVVVAHDVVVFVVVADFAAVDDECYVLAKKTISFGAHVEQQLTYL